MRVSKSVFKSKALEIMRIAEAGEEVVTITSRGKDVLTLQVCKAVKSPLEQLRGSVISFDDPTSPVDEEWEASR